MTPEQIAYQAGRDAYADGKGWTDTPYSGDRNLTGEWVLGWLAAHKDAQPCEHCNGTGEEPEVTE